MVQPICSAYWKSTESIASIRFGLDRAGADVRAQRHVREDGELRLRIESFDVLRGIRFGESQRLRFGQRVPELDAVPLHAAQDVIAGAVEDTGDPRQPVAGKSMFDRADDRHSAGHRGLETDAAPRPLGRRRVVPARHGR